MLKFNKLAILAAICCGSPAIALEGRQAYYESNEFDTNRVVTVSHCDCGEAACGCETVASEPACGLEMVPEPACGLELMDDPGCGAEMGSRYGDRRGGEASCDIDLLGQLSNRFVGCESDDPWVLFGEHCGWSAGGWTQIGYFDKATSLFNSRADEVQLQQAWFYAEKAIDTSYGFDLGGRFDYLYGTDSQDTQAFGTGQRGWDNSWDNGPDYGHAMPQAYLEAGYGDWSVKVGHFYTIIGWEVVQATGNFFYSHAYTMYNSEPFTHTGALATYNVTDDVKAYGGYVLGWDSGFDDNGDAFLGGLSATLTDDLTVTYATIFGRFGDLPLGTPEKGYMHSIVADVTLTEKLQYIFQSDVLDSDNSTGATVRKTFDINQYLIYSFSDRLATGTRFEWYDAKAGVLGTTGSDVYALTSGINFKPHANITIRPEIRRDWVFGDKTGVLENSASSQTTFGMDTIFTF